MFTDYRGKELVPGVRVAYNRSGEVKLGEIVSISSNRQRQEYMSRPYVIDASGNPFATIVVKGDDNKLSKLSRLTNLVVLD